MRSVFLFTISVIVLSSCKFVEEKKFGPLKPIAAKYQALLTDTIVDHNPNVIKYINLDTASFILTVKYDQDHGNIDELSRLIETLDLIAPIINDTLVQAQLEEENKAKLDTAISSFIEKEIITNNNDSEEIARLDSLQKAHHVNDSLPQVDSTLAKDSTKLDTSSLSTF